MNIVITINHCYALPATVMLTSLFDWHKAEKHSVYLLYAEKNLEKDDIERIRATVERFGHSFFPKALDESCFSGFKVDYHFSVEAYFRFLIQSVLPQEEERAIYLEADQIIKGDISEFYYGDMKGKCVAVCRAVNDHPDILLRKLHLPEDTMYFNSGVILYDLKRLRETIRQEAYFEYLRTFPERITWMDQDVLNVLYADCKMVADYRKYNFQVSYKTVLTQEDMLGVERDTRIIHYIGSAKPWLPGYHGQLLKYYMQYEKMACSRAYVLRMNVLRMAYRGRRWMKSLIAGR